MRTASVMAPTSAMAATTTRRLARVVATAATPALATAATAATRRFVFAREMRPHADTPRRTSVAVPTHAMPAMTGLSQVAFARAARLRERSQLLLRRAAMSSATSLAA
jgi:hypothetical protein